MNVGTCSILLAVTTITLLPTRTQSSSHYDAQRTFSFNKRSERRRRRICRHYPQKPTPLPEITAAFLTHSQSPPRHCSCSTLTLLSSYQQCVKQMMIYNQQQQQHESLPSKINPTNKIYNPNTKRSIQQTPLHKNSKRKNKWYEFMMEQGGYMAYNSILCKLNLEKLIAWQDDGGKVGTKNDGHHHHHHGNEEFRNGVEKNLKPKEREDWYVVTPTIITPASSSSLLPRMALEETAQLPHLDQLLFVYKPSKMLTLPGKDTTNTSVCLSEQVNYWLDTTQEGQTILQNAKFMEAQLLKSNKTKRKKKKKQNVYKPRPCHRLDYDTSGIIVFGLTATSHRYMSSLFEHRLIYKRYVALVAGHVFADSEGDFGEGVIDVPIGKMKTKEGFNKWSCYNEANNKREDFVEKSIREAKTSWQVSKLFDIPLPQQQQHQNEERKDNDDNNNEMIGIPSSPSNTCSKTTQAKTAKYTRIKLIPHTGRGHQLRLHMKHIKHPILGDELHAPKNTIAHVCQERLCLHAECLQFHVFDDGKEGTKKTTNDDDDDACSGDDDDDDGKEGGGRWRPCCIEAFVVPPF